jgi:hypothetical protein
MKVVAKILIDFDETDSIAARKRLRDLADSIIPLLPAEGRLRDFKMVEDGSGRLIEKIETDKP